MSGHDCIDGEGRPCALADCVDHPRWSVVRSLWVGEPRWFAFPPSEVRYEALRATQAEAFDYAYTRARGGTS